MMDVPNLVHALMLDEIDLQLSAYRLLHRGRITLLAGGSDAKIELPGMESDRHPDRAIYLTPPPPSQHPWDSWIPAIVVEVVSPGAAARHRDLVEKREEYLAAGVIEYWIIDPQQRCAIALRRHGDEWRERSLAAGEHLLTPLLPDFVLQLAPVFAVLDRPGAK